MRLVLLHLPKCSRASVISTALEVGAYPHHDEPDSWLYPPSQPTIQFAWRGHLWPQSAASQGRISAALQGCPFDSLELRVSVGSPTELVRALVASILGAHGGVAQVELGLELWPASSLQAGSAQAAVFASRLLQPAA